MAEKIRFEPPMYCAFCGKDRRLVSKLVQCDFGICICDECIDVAYELVHKNEKEERSGTMAELMPCPWCGGEAIIYERRKLDGSDAFFKYSIGCGNKYCEIRPQTGFWKYKSEAEYSWNRRAK